jgi:hypothetical protein
MTSEPSCDDSVAEVVTLQYVAAIDKTLDRVLKALRTVQGAEFGPLPTADAAGGKVRSAVEAAIFGGGALLGPMT